MTAAEKQLACAVINLAIEDALAPPPLAGCPNYADRPRIRYEALHFLTGKTGAWAEAHHFWCVLADIAPDALRERVILCLTNDEALRRMAAAARRLRDCGMSDAVMGRRSPLHIQGQFCSYPVNLIGVQFASNDCAGHA